MKRFSKVFLFIPVIFILIGSVNAQEIKKEFHAGRRAELYKKMANGILILSAGKSQASRNSDMPFKQDYNFWYLTGYTSPDAIILITPKAANKYVLFMPKTKIFNRTTRKIEQKDIVEETIANYGADTVYFLEDFEKVFKRYSAEEKNIYCSQLDKETFDIISKCLKGETGNTAKTLKDPLQLIAELRMIKTDEEIEFIKKAIDITTEAHIEAMKASMPKMNERVLDAIIGYIYRLRWASGFGFQSIVGSGPNSLITHYQDNKNEMKDGAVCVMDLGAAYNGYSADITRTIPVNGTFTKEQKEIYQAVLSAEKIGISLLKPGAIHQVISDKVANCLRDELFKLGLVTDTNRTWQYKIWYSHGCSHPIGLDVHDVTSANFKKEGFKPNMIFTMEPGIYVGESRLEKARLSRGENVSEKEFNEFYEKVLPIVKKYNNIGVRIEDDILVTKDGNIVLTAKCPKEIADVEKTMKQKSRFVD